jgi:hypothetical protein
MGKYSDLHTDLSQVRFSILLHEASFQFWRRNESDLWRDSEQSGLKVLWLRECAHSIRAAGLLMRLVIESGFVTLGYLAKGHGPKRHVFE